ncbi:hypothetical protein DOY81_000031 [Sarcophaga bullata]|nr:hypothetical protein DOY81_000031 [Sarcophaga bullata]
MVNKSSLNSRSTTSQSDRRSSKRKSYLKDESPRLNKTKRSEMVRNVLM